MKKIYVVEVIEPNQKLKHLYNFYIEVLQISTNHGKKRKKEKSESLFQYGL
jgi:hypothetical protein